jgi:excisionase family DNA binding protein
MLQTNKLLFSIKETAALLGVSVSTVRNFLRSGKIRCIRVGNLLKFSEAELVTFLDNGVKKQEGRS